jgi:cytochrome c
MLQMKRRDGGKRVWAAMLMLAAATQLTACGWAGGQRTSVTLVPGGDPGAGREAIRRYGCTSCHVVPGIQAAEAHVGPPLHDFAKRSYIGGVAPNTTANLILWIQSPQAISEQTAMPPLGVSEEEARDMAAYLYTLD